MKIPAKIFRRVSSVAFAVAVLLAFGGCEDERRAPRAIQKKSPVIIAESAGAGPMQNRWSASDAKEVEPEEETELAIILNPTIEMEEVPQVMRDVVIDLAHQFPGTTFTAVAYIPTDPPQRVCSAKFDAHTGKATFKWETGSEKPLEKGVIRI